jgi:hypothetical protein
MSIRGAETRGHFASITTASEADFPGFVQKSIDCVEFFWPP